MGDKDKSDSKSKKTMSKIGKLFGVSEPPKTNASSTDLPSTKNHSPPAHPISDNEDFIISQQENDSVSPLPKETLTPTASSRANTPGNRSPNHNLSGHTSPDSATSNEGNGYLSFENLQQPKPSASVTDANLQKINSSLLNSSGTPLAAPNPRPSPSVSRNSSVHVPRKQMASPVTKSTPVSRASSTKAKTSSNTNITSHASSTSIPSMANQAAAKPRFRMLENGSHEHNLRSAKRQEKLSNMLKDLLGAKKLRDEAKSAVPNILKGQLGQAPANSKGADKPPTLFAGLVNHIKNNTSPYHAGTQVDDSQNPIVGSEPGTILETVPYLPTNANSTAQDSRSFVQKYGRCQEVIGRGSFGVVRICHKKPDSNSQEEMLYAVKEFKRKPNESDQKYNRRLTSEFCISSSLKNINIIETLDLLKDAKGDYCEVMEFCSGGDLYTLIIASNKLEYAEADCFFKQLIRGVNYMHDMGVSHRDLKPENILLTQNGIIKITDFGNGECFKMAWEDEVQLSEGICGSSPYIAPEEFTQSSFDPRGVDIWACGVIYMAMRTGRQLWKLANPKKDEFFEEYLVKRKAATGYDPIESLKRARCRNVIYSILDPKPERRITGKQILNSEWGREIKVCEAGEGHAV